MERSKMQDNVMEDTVAITRINKLTGELMDLCGALVQSSALQLGFKQVNVLLGLVGEIITGTSNAVTNRSSKETSENLFYMLSSLIISLNANTLLESEHFMSLLQQLTTIFRRQLIILILQRIIKNDLDPSTSLCLLSADKVLELCKILHDDSLQILLLGESQKEAKLVEKVLLQILDKTPSSEEALRIMCEARHFLSRFNSIFSLFISRALALAYQHASNFSQKKKNIELLRPF
ncbi:Vacuolar protein sorting-associated protein 35 [Trypanosoma melophagium]|uniref:Vacuolar protein sorting-associated protein 35 n=1 Tax=Trypanosoma melophagium TaxID=715481 RepID=UPI00351A70D8|nr:Vacuolar protein sorting-associated protein 35 [Trypanosoma melophagium]